MELSYYCVFILFAMFTWTQRSEATISGWTATKGGSPVTLSGTSFPVIVPENIADDAEIITLTATSNGVLSAYSIAVEPNSGQFEILPADASGPGVVTLQTGQVLDREAAETVEIVVRGVDGDGSSSTTVLITLTDYNDFAPQFTSPSSATFTTEVPDLSPVGTTVYTVAATDDDADQTENVVTYTIGAGNTNSDFALDGSTGVITVANALDKATTASYELVVLGTDAGTDPGMKTGTVTITVNVCDPCSTDNGSITIKGSVLSIIALALLILYMFERQ